MTTNNNNTNLQATVVVEHLLQASNVAHTMQHWHIYRKWNDRLFLKLQRRGTTIMGEAAAAEYVAIMRMTIDGNGTPGVPSWSTTCALATLLQKRRKREGIISVI